MLPIVITSLVLETRRRLGEVIPPELGERWDHLELRILVLVSLCFQIILIALGSRRKNTGRYCIRIVVWCAYLSADKIAIYALGVIQRGSPPAEERDRTTELRVFWTPFLLMHLGGPDTITAYALEDNELWLRQFLELLSQTVATLYILLLSCNGSYISWLCVVVLICGLIKCGERVWVLQVASSEQFRDLTLERQQMNQNLEKAAEGHAMVKHQVIELHGVSDHDVGVNRRDKETKLSRADLYELSQEEILIAADLIDIFQPAFTDQPLSLNDRNSSRLKLKDKYYSSVFNIIAIELGFIYDLLYTKVMLFQTPWGFASRVVSLSLTSITLGIFTFFHWKEASEYKYDTMDLSITFVLMVAAVFLDLYAFLFHHLFSDQVICWLIKHKHSNILIIIDWLRPLHKRQRWSNKIGQFSLASYSLKKKHFLCRHKILQKIQKYFYHSNVNVSNVIKDRLYDHITTIPANMYTDLLSLWTEKWKDRVQNKELDNLKWSIKLEFDTSVLVWHIATEICFQAFRDSTSQVKDECDDDPAMDNVTSEDAQVSLDLSRYMLHLFDMYPSMLPAGIGRTKFEDIHSNMSTFFEQCQSAEQEEGAMAENPISEQCQSKEEAPAAENLTYAENDSDQKSSVIDACMLLLNRENTQLNSDKSGFVMSYGSRLAKQLKEIKEDHFRFRLLCETWIGMLTLAAVKCDASYHLEQLRRGGELLTHVWLLLVHFGFTDHFQIPNAVEIAEVNDVSFD